MKKTYLTLAMFVSLAACKSNEEVEQDTQTSEPSITKVETTFVKSSEGSSSLKYSGLVEAKETTPLSFKTMGTVTQILVSEGQFVKKGQLLAKLDATNSNSTYELALQKKQQAEDAYKRMKPMKENGTLPEIKWVEIETGLNQATIATEMAKRSIGDNNLYAPKSGVIGSKNIQVGVNIMPSVSAFDLMDINSVYVNIPVPENEVGQLKKGQVSEIFIAATSQTVAGKIDQVGVAANPISHTYPVKILVRNSGYQIKPGMVCNVNLSNQKTYEGLTVSAKALQLNAQGQQYVYLVEGNSAIVKPVTVENLLKNEAVVKGLNLGDVVVISGQNKLRDGAKIQTINKI